MGKALRVGALGLASAAGYLLMAAPARAATIYYSNDFSGTASSGNFLVTATPEPATLGFLGVAGASLGLRRRRASLV